VWWKYNICMYGNITMKPLCTWIYTNKNFKYHTSLKYVENNDKKKRRRRRRKRRRKKRRSRWKRVRNLAPSAFSRERICHQLLQGKYLVYECSNKFSWVSALDMPCIRRLTWSDCVTSPYLDFLIYETGITKANL
jgi:hypothetical protein